MTQYWLLGLALMLVIEGIMPFLFPELWRASFQKLVAMNNGQLRFMGIASMLSGLILLYWVQ